MRRPWGAPAVPTALGRRTRRTKRGRRRDRPPGVVRLARRASAAVRCVVCGVPSASGRRSQAATSNQPRRHRQGSGRRSPAIGGNSPGRLRGGGTGVFGGRCGLSSKRSNGAETPTQFRPENTCFPTGTGAPRSIGASVALFYTVNQVGMIGCAETAPLRFSVHVGRLHARLIGQ